MRIYTLQKAIVMLCVALCEKLVSSFAKILKVYFSCFGLISTHLLEDITAASDDDVVVVFVVDDDPGSDKSVQVAPIC